MILESLGEDQEKTIIPIRRTETNTRKRPSGDTRYYSINDLNPETDRLNLLNAKDLEWLAWNWRLNMQQEIFGTRKQMVYENFNRSIAMLPTPKQIFTGIIMARIE